MLWKETSAYTFGDFETIPPCDRQVDGQTPCNTVYRSACASRGKNCVCLLLSVQVTVDTSLGDLALMLNTENYVVVMRDQRQSEFYTHLHPFTFYRAKHEDVHTALGPLP